MFTSRAALKKVPRFGAKTFEQAAGFLRVAGSNNPLDASAVHPESYGVVKKIAAKNNRQIRDLIGDSSFLRSLNAADYTDESVGLPTVTDIISELDKPGRDPRPKFETARFQEGVDTIKDLEAGMILEGSVTNVTNFGAFVDIGVHQDGLVHISALADQYVKDPRDVVKAGDVVKVKVMQIDVDRKRIGLSMRLDDQPGEATDGGGARRTGKPRGGSNRSGRGKSDKNDKRPAMGSMGALLQDAMKKQ